MFPPLALVGIVLRFLASQLTGGWLFLSTLMMPSAWVYQVTMMCFSSPLQKVCSAPNLKPRIFGLFVSLPNSTVQEISLPPRSSFVKQGYLSIRTVHLCTRFRFLLTWLDLGDRAFDLGRVKTTDFLRHPNGTSPVSPGRGQNHKGKAFRAFVVK